MQTAIITGAGSGIGQAVALKLHARHWNVGLVGRSAERLEETARLMLRKQQNDGLLVLPADISVEPEVRRVVERVHATWGFTDALVNNAGVAPVVPIEAT